MKRCEMAEKWVIIKPDGSIRGTAERFSEAYIKAWNGDIIRGDIIRKEA